MGLIAFWLRCKYSFLVRALMVPRENDVKDNVVRIEMIRDESYETRVVHNTPTL